MTIALVQSSDVVVGSTVTLPAPCTASNLIVCMMSERSADQSAGYLPSGFTAVGTGPVTGTPVGLSNNGSTIIGYKVAAGGEQVFLRSVTFTSSGAMVIAEFSGAGTLDASDEFGSQGPSAAPHSPALTPTSGVSVLLVSTVNVNAEFDPGFTASAGWTQIGTQPGSPSSSLAYQIVATSAGSYTYTPTYSGASGGYGGVIAAFTAAPAIPSPGVWLDFDGDGFTDGTTTGAEIGYLTMEFPEGGSSGVSDDITTDTISIDIDQGGTTEVTGGSGTDTCTITVKNTTGKYSPDNASSVVYGKVKPGKDVWIGVNADGTLTGTGQTIYGLFAGKVREIAPLPVGGATNTPTTEIICDGILQDYTTPVHVADSLARSQQTFRTAVLDAIGESATRRDLAVEADPLPLSSADSISALSVLDELNKSNGTRHFIATDSDKDTWYKYTTRNRNYKNGAAADATINAGSDHLTGASWRYNNDSVTNSARAAIDPIDFPPSPSTVWEYATVPFTVAGNVVIWANFEDYVANPTLTIVTASGVVTSSITTFGRSAKIELYSASAQVSLLTVEGSQVIRRQGVSVISDDFASQGTFGIRATDLSGDLVGAQATAQGIVDHLVWRYGSRPLKRPSIDATNWLPYLFSLHLYDQIAVTLGAVSAAAVKFEIVGRKLHCDVAASASLVNWQGSFQLAESRIQGTQTWFTLDSSVLDGPDLLAY